MKNRITFFAGLIFINFSAFAQSPAIDDVLSTIKSDRTQLVAISSYSGNSSIFSFNFDLDDAVSFTFLNTKVVEIPRGYHRPIEEITKYEIGFDDFGTDFETDVYIKPERGSKDVLSLGNESSRKFRPVVKQLAFEKLLKLLTVAGFNSVLNNATVVGFKLLAIDTISGSKIRGNTLLVRPSVIYLISEFGEKMKVTFLNDESMRIDYFSVIDGFPYKTLRISAGAAEDKYLVYRHLIALQGKTSLLSQITMRDGIEKQIETNIARIQNGNDTFLKKLNALVSGAKRLSGLDETEISYGFSDNTIQDIINLKTKEICERLL